MLTLDMKVLVVHRRLFEGDSSRFFVGRVEDYESGVIKVTGYTWMKDIYTGLFIRKEDIRTKLISLTSGSLIVYQLPGWIQIQEIKFENYPDGGFGIRDGEKFRMDLSESVHHTPSHSSGHTSGQPAGPKR